MRRVTILVHSTHRRHCERDNVNNRQLHKLLPICHPQRNRNQNRMTLRPFHSPSPFSRRMSMSSHIAIQCHCLVAFNYYVKVNSIELFANNHSRTHSHVRSYARREIFQKRYLSSLSRIVQSFRSTAARAETANATHLKFTNCVICREIIIRAKKCTQTHRRILLTKSTETGPLPSHPLFLSLMMHVLYLVNPWNHKVNWKSLTFRFLFRGGDPDLAYCCCTAHHTYTHRHP